MALGSLAVNPDSGLKIIPCGMNYFHAHKFRSRAVVEFGNPIAVPEELIELYKSGERREATRQLLETVYQALVAVTVTSPDYDTLMVRIIYVTVWKGLFCLRVAAHPGGSSAVQSNPQEAAVTDDCRTKPAACERLHPLQGRSANH